MHDALFVRGFERIGDLACDGQRLLDRNRAPLDALGQRFALHQFHDEVVRADIVQRADIGMIQRGDRAGFALEAVAESLGGDFYGHFTMESGIGRAIDLAHATGADRRKDLVGTETGPR